MYKVEDIKARMHDEREEKAEYFLWWEDKRRALGRQGYGWLVAVFRTSNRNCDTNGQWISKIAGS